MKIHFYDISTNSFGFGNISSLAKVNHYLPPTVDKIIQKTEKKMELLQKIIKNRSEDLLYQKNNQEIIWEIGNCLKARAFAFRDLATLINLITTGNMVKSNGTIWGLVNYTEKSAELFQTALFTNDVEIIWPLVLDSIRLTIPSDGVDSITRQLLEEKGQDMLEPPKNLDNFPVRPLLSDSVYPILIENFTDLPFIIGDTCVPETEYLLHDLKTKIPQHHFPISPDLAIKLLEEEEHEVYFPRIIGNRREIYKLNS